MVRKSIKTLKNLIEKYKFYRKVFRKLKVVGFNKKYLLILSL